MFLFLSVMFGMTAIGCAIIAVTNMLTSAMFPKDMLDGAWPYTKKTYIFLGWALLLLIISVLLGVL